MEDIRTSFMDLIQTFTDDGFTEQEIFEEFSYHVRHQQTKRMIDCRHLKQTVKWICFFIIISLAVCFIAYPYSSGIILSLVTQLAAMPQGYECLIENNMFAREISRTVLNCSFCEGLHDIKLVTDISHEEFFKEYAYSAIPILIKGAANYWSALDIFSFEYFKSIYTDVSLNITEEDCQFFKYDTQFESLREAFQMPEERVKFHSGHDPWYFGWSNCDPRTKRLLRQHYRRPSFLPADSESSSLDWIFMGGSGEGAHIHLDHVGMPSWQAQISGEKTWNLYPVPECERYCKPLSVTMQKGDIFFVDTNQWYHSTFIHPGECSITIGSEYN